MDGYKQIPLTAVPEYMDAQRTHNPDVWAYVVQKTTGDISTIWENKVMSPNIQVKSQSFITSGKLLNCRS